MSTEPNTTEDRDMNDTITRQRVTWCRWDARQLKQVHSESWQWIWTDSEGYERCYNTKSEAEQARVELGP